MSNQLSSYFLISKLAFSNVTLFSVCIRATAESPKGTEFTEYMRFIKSNTSVLDIYALEW